MMIETAESRMVSCESAGWNGKLKEPCQTNKRKEDRK